MHALLSVVLTVAAGYWKVKEQTNNFTSASPRPVSSAGVSGQGLNNFNVTAPVWGIAEVASSQEVAPGRYVKL